MVQDNAKRHRAFNQKIFEPDRPRPALPRGVIDWCAGGFVFGRSRTRVAGARRAWQGAR